jgi:gluconate 2-dehydrogenase gamma chain
MSEVQGSARQRRRLPLFADAGGDGTNALAIAPGWRSDPVSMDGDAAKESDYVFFNSQEAVFVEAAVDTLLPPDQLGPGALELGVAIFIDRQLSASTGWSDRGRGKTLARARVISSRRPEWTAPALIKSGIADVDAFSLDARGSSFAELGPSERAAVLSEVECGEAGLAIVPNATFFSLLLQLTVEGYLAAPLHNAGERALPAGRARRRSLGGAGLDWKKRSDPRDTASAELAQ